MNNFARIFFESGYRSLEFYTALFAILRECDFSSANRPDLEEMVREMRENPKRSSEEITHVTLALNAIFPKQERATFLR